jgi:hypothetical protein
MPRRIVLDGNSQLLGQPTPAADDPDGAWYTFERGVRKTEGGHGWIEPAILVSAGVGKQKELVFTKNPIPVAFVDASTNGIDKAKDFNELEVLKKSNSKWVPWPSGLESQRRERIQYLQNPPPQFDFAPSAGEIDD